MIVGDRIAALRGLMEEKGLSAYIIYGTDPHGSEIVSEHWACRSWISGFTGSAGTVVVTREKAGLWTDFRYFIQAARELEGSGIDLFKGGTPGIPGYQDWLGKNLAPGAVVGTHGPAMMLKEWESMAESFSEKHILIDGTMDLIADIWKDRPREPESPVWLLPKGSSEYGRTDKIQMIRKDLGLHGMDATFISSLDDIAWILNIRGGDVPFNPVVQSYLYISQKRVIWFVQGSKLNDAAEKAISEAAVGIQDYDRVSPFLASLDGSLFISPEKTNSFIISSLPETLKLVKGVDFSTRLKACKDKVEQQNIRKAMEKDGAAMVRFCIWLKRRLHRGCLSELDAAHALKGFRKEQEGYLMESFNPIPAYRSHGAICHYEAMKDSQYMLEEDGLFLVDSGGQYREGTTDISRTLSLGNITERQKRDYTLVLKGHIALSRVVFPEGTRGYQLDVLAKLALWNAGLNYGHGTGHGVGYILNVHEGPQRISSHPVDEALCPGMVCSNEPGLYREGEYGIRIENLILVRKVEKEDMASRDAGEEVFYSFETLTLCPYERDLIDTDLLNAEEISWINHYHREVFCRISPLLPEDEKIWLKEACREIP